MVKGQKDLKVVTTRQFEKRSLKGVLLEIMKSQLERLKPASITLSIHYSTFWSALSVAITTLLYILGFGKANIDALVIGGIAYLSLYVSWIVFAVTFIVTILFGCIIRCSANQVEQIVNEVYQQND